MLGVDEAEVLAQVPLADERVLHAVVGDERDAGLLHGAGAAGTDAPPRDLEGTAGHADAVVERAGKADVAGAGQSDEADDLAGADHEVADVDAADMPVTHREGDRTGRARLGLGAPRPDAAGTTQHHVDERALLELRRLLGADQPAVAEHGDPVGERLDLREEVADQHHPYPLRRQAADDPPELLLLAGGQRRRRFVEDDEGDVAAERPDDLDDLLVGHRQLADRAAEVNGHLGKPARDQRRRPGAQGAAADDAAGEARLVAEEDVVGAGQRRDEAALLADEGDAADEGVARAGERDRRAADLDGAGGRLEAAAEHADQRRLAGTVLADDPVDLVGAEGDGDVAERARPGELLGDAGKTDVHGERLPAGQASGRWRKGRGGRASGRPGSIT